MTTNAPDFPKSEAIGRKSQSSEVVATNKTTVFVVFACDLWICVLSRRSATDNTPETSPGNYILL